MQLETLALDLRPRSMWEASDLGVRLVQTQARSVWRSFLPVYALVVLLALATFEIADWLPGLVIFWLKPWLDRSLLFVLARAVFGEPTRLADLWRARGPVWGGQWLRTLTLRRLSPWRSYTQAIGQLEGQRGAAFRQRRRQVLAGRRGAALGLYNAFASVEAVLVSGLFALVLWFALPGHAGGLMEALFDADSAATSLFATLAYVVVVGALEPFFVGAGFAMYLNRRVELEAWDIEQEFRRVFAA